MLASFIRQHSKTSLVFLITFLLYLSNTPIDFQKDFYKEDFRRLMTSSDQTSNTFLPWLLLTKHTILFDDIDQYIIRFDGFNKVPYYLTKQNGHTYSSYPILTGIAAVPVYAVPVLLNKIPDLKYYDNILKVLLLGRITAAFYAAATTTIVFLTLNKISNNRFSQNKFLVYLFTILFAFGTTVWSISSRGLWQHTVSGFFISLIVYFLVNIKPKYVPLIGALLGLSVLTRSTNAIVAVVLTVFIFLHYRKYFIGFILSAAPFALMMMAYNYYVYGSPFTEGYGQRNDLQWNTPLIEGLTGFLFSPARSFLFVSPPLVLSYLGIYKVFKDRNFGGSNNTAYKYISIAFLISFIFFAKWKGWSGANGFGYRNLTDYLPIVTVLSIETASWLFSKIKVNLLAINTILILLVIWSITVNANAVFQRKGRCPGSANWKFVCLVESSKPGQ